MFTCTGVEATPLLISEAGIRREQEEQFYPDLHTSKLFSLFPCTCDFKM